MAVQIHPSHHAQARVPRGAVWGAGAVIVTALVLAAYARHSDVGTTRTPDAAVVSAIDVHFADRADGAVVVTREPDGRVIGVLAPGTNGFARGALRGLARDRRRAGIGAETPFTLTRWADGRLSLSDRLTGRRIELDAFGPDNSGVFVRLLVAGAAN